MPMMPRRRSLLAALLVAGLGLPLLAQDPGLKDTFQQGKALWATQGDREGATSKFEKVLEALAPKGKALDPEWMEVLSETYNWLAVLDDRNASTKARAQTRLQALLDLNPDFELDKNITSQRLAATYDQLRASKLSSLKLTLEPEDGLLILDGKPVQPTPRKYLAFGSHKLAYTRAGFAPVEAAVELAPKETKAVELKLTRVASTVRMFVHPSGAEVLLDGKSLGKTKGVAGPEAKPFADKAGVQVEELSEAFMITDLKPGKHVLELQAPCFRPRRIELGDSFTNPLADHTLDALKLEPSKGTLTVTSAWEGGELFLSGQSYGNLPLDKLPVCAGPYEALVRFPVGGYSQRIQVEDGKSMTIEARPKPRLAFLGMEASADFTGRVRLLSQLQSMGERLSTVAFIPPRAGEAPKDAMARLKAAHEAELFLVAVPVPDKVIHQVDLVLSTVDGEEERVSVKPLEQDPLGGLVARMGAVPALTEPGVPMTLLDVPEEEGPWVLAADAVQAKGVQAGKPLAQVNGKPASGGVAGFKALLRDLKDKTVSVAQGGAAVPVPVAPQPLEIPVNSQNLCYPFLLTHLRLLSLGAKGDEGALVRLNLAIVLMHFRKFDKALEVLRDTRMSSVRGVSQGTLDYYTGLCFLKLGGVYNAEATQAFQQALKYPLATLFGPDGPLVAPLAKQALEELKY